MHSQQKDCFGVSDFCSLFLKRPYFCLIYDTYGIYVKQVFLIADTLLGASVATNRQVIDNRMSENGEASDFSKSYIYRAQVFHLTNQPEIFCVTYSWE